MERLSSKEKRLCLGTDVYTSAGFSDVHNIQQMRRITRSQTAANLRFQENLTSAAIHRLPNEVIARILVIGCPLPQHERDFIDASPLMHQILVTSICALWRQIMHNSPPLWTSVVVRPPPSMKSLGLHQNLLSAVLTRSGTLDLDISIRVPANTRRGWHVSLCYDLLTPHLSRAHTLDVETWDPHVDLIPVSRIPELNKVRHLYLKGMSSYNPVVLPPNARNSPLETLHYAISRPLLMSSVPTTELQNVSFGFSRRSTQTKDIVRLFESSKLRMLDLGVWAWESGDAVSSPTLTRLDLTIWEWERRSGSCIVGLLPNLLHLRLKVSVIRGSGDGVTWPSLPSLRSLNIVIDKHGRRCGPYLENLLQGAQQLVALQIWDAVAPEAVSFFRAQRHENDVNIGPGGNSLRLVRVIVRTPVSTGRHDELSDLAVILRERRPSIRTEWYIDPPEESWARVVFDGIEATTLPQWTEEPSPPLFRCADEIISGNSM
jgi:hypothetical protein